MENKSKFDEYLNEISTKKDIKANDNKNNSYLKRLKAIDRNALINKENLRRSKDQEVDREKRKKESEKRNNFQRALSKLSS